MNVDSYHLRNSPSIAELAPHGLAASIRLESRDHGAYAKNMIESQ